MLKVGGMLVNPEQVQVVNFTPNISAVSLIVAGQMTTFVGSDAVEAWAFLKQEDGFVQVGKTQGEYLINSHLVGFAWLQPGVDNLAVFRIGGRDYTFADPGDFDFSQLRGMAAAESDKVVFSDPPDVAAAPVAESAGRSDWEELKKNGG